MVSGTIAATSFCFAAARTGSPRSGCKFHRSHFGSRYKFGCCGHASLSAACSDSCWLAHCTWCVQVVECGVLLGICRSGVSALTRARSRTLHYHRPVQAHQRVSFPLYKEDLKVLSAFRMRVLLCQSKTRMRKADSTLRSSRAVPHPSTNRALRRLTSEVRRDPVHSTRYGRQRN